MMLKRRPILQLIPIEKLQRGKYQPRQVFDPEKLQELADSINATGGLLQPIVVRPINPTEYEIVAGERRWRAAQLAHLSEVQCLIYCYTDEQALQASIVENISRADLNPLEEAKAYQRLIDEFGYLHEEVAASVGRSRTAITNSLRLLKLDNRIQDFIITGTLSEGHGKMLASLDHALQMELAQRIIKNGWNVRKLESAIKKLHAEPTDEGKYSSTNLRNLEIALSEHVGNKVQFDCEERGGGFMKIRFNNVDELEGHFDRLGFGYNQNEK